MKDQLPKKRRTIVKARNVVVVHSDKKQPPDLNHLAKALIAWKLKEAQAALAAQSENKPEPDQ
ncbi:hypothetical protein HA133_01685 [Mycobacteroides chelonae]|uniref:hypothetical protein n=1 Tax=Mycobacteroides chelonae TaxID=1774 RepID=UPI0018B0A849|nr:hypothetical protein [Mycobacteroides chelonae]MBF9434646.1 hypothetical protein [Mycobacteroides chelonae]